PGGGGDIDAADQDPDAAMNPDAPDTGMATPTVGGTLAVFDATVVDPEAAAVGGVRGGTIRFSFNDFTMNGGTNIFGTSAIGGCLVTKFDATHRPNPRLDAGAITVSAPATGDSALLKTVGPCTLQAAFGEPDPYVCISNTATGNATIGAQDRASNSTVVYTLASPTVDLGMSPPVTIATLVRATNVVTVTTAAAHGYQSGMLVTVAGSGTFNVAGVPITVTGATTFTYPNAGADEAGVTLGTSSVPTNRIVGSALVVNGLTNTAFNSGTSAFPIVAQVNANTVIVVNPAPADGAAQAPVTTASYTILNGFSPVPAAGALANFLGGSAAPNTPSSIRIQKAANTVWPAIDVTIDVPGEARRPVGLTAVTRASNVVTATTSVNHDFLVGQVLTVAGVLDNSFNRTDATVVSVTANTFTYADTDPDGASTGGTAVKPGGFALDTTSASLTAFQTTGAATMVKYSCDNATVGAANVFDDTCGDESTAILKAFIISGSATKKPLTGLLPFQMPTEIPGTDEWLEWQCAFIGGKSGTMPAAAVQAIMDFDPTRVEQQVLFVGGTILDGTGPNVQTLRVLSGHALAGHTTFP
ncbi:MAG TPA: hypothetical protein VM261_31550, partial [Kofleriaceae bacterium]|nr:hypothetical protein [Kofleriaceae bacterium]